MKGNSHVVIGALGGVIACCTPSPSPTIGMVLACMVVGGITALVPDIDHRHSTISHKVGILRWVVFWLPHRGFTHSLLAVALVGAGAWALVGAGVPVVVGISLVVGYASHIVADMLTVRGVMLLYPKNIFVGFPIRIRTGGIIEALIAFMCACALVYLLVAKTAGF